MQRPRSLDARARSTIYAPSPLRLARGQGLAVVSFYARARFSGVAALDVDDVQLSAHKGILRVFGKG